MNRCRKRAAVEEQTAFLSGRSLKKSVAQSTPVAGGNEVAFAAIESSMCKRRRTAMPSLLTDLRDADAAITGSEFVLLGDAQFYRGSGNTGDGDTALIFASDGQLELPRSCRLVYVNATLGCRCLRYFISYLRWWIMSQLFCRKFDTLSSSE